MLYIYKIELYIYINIYIYIYIYIILYYIHNKYIIINNIDILSTKPNPIFIISDLLPCRLRF